MSTGTNQGYKMILDTVIAILIIFIVYNILFRSITRGNDTIRLTDSLIISLLVTLILTIITGFLIISSGFLFSSIINNSLKDISHLFFGLVFLGLAILNTFMYFFGNPLADGSWVTSFEFSFVFSVLGGSFLVSGSIHRYLKI